MVIYGISKRVLLSSFTRMLSQVNYTVQSSSVGCYYGNRRIDLLIMPVKVRWFQRCRCVHTSKMLLSVASQCTASMPDCNKISRFAKAEAQAVLLDYLQNTRTFQVADADHISRNSESFLLGLIAKLDCEKNVAKSLSRDLMYLSDNKVLLDNFHDLCDYGIPRGKMGKIYAEAECIFKYDRGVLTSKFRAYEELGLSKSSLIKFFTCDPSLLVGDVDTKFIGFLRKLNMLGLENDWLSRYLSAKSSYNWARMSETVEILFRLGYGERNVAILFRNEPGLLLENSGWAIHILVGQLIKLGFERADVVTLFLQDPKLMSKKCLKNLSRSMTFLFEIGMKLEDISYVVRTHKHILSSNKPKRPRTVLGTLKVGESALRTMIKDDPTKMFISSSTTCSEDYKDFSFSLQAPTRCLEKTRFLKLLGYVENSDEFVQVAKSFRGRGDQLHERFNCLVESGLDSYTAVDIVKRVPQILNQTKEVLEQKIHLLTHVIGYPLGSLVSSPTYLCYGVKRINLRFSMYAWLRSRDAAKPAMSLSTILGCSDKQFVKFFVDIHEHGPAAWAKLKESSLTGKIEL